MPSSTSVSQSPHPKTCYRSRLQGHLLRASVKQPLQNGSPQTRLKIVSICLFQSVFGKHLQRTTFKNVIQESLQKDPVNSGLRPDGYQALLSTDGLEWFFAHKKQRVNFQRMEDGQRASSVSPTNGCVKIGLAFAIKRCWSWLRVRRTVTVPPATTF